MPITKVYHKHRGVTFRIRGENKRLTENYWCQRALIRSQNIRMHADERKSVAARMANLSLGLQKEFLQMRLHAIEQRLMEENTGY